MSAMRMLFPLFLIGGGVALAISTAKADAKKKKIDEAFDLGLDEPDIDQPPLPPAMSRAYSRNPINQETFNGWWYEASGYPQTGVMGFWLDIDLPSAGLDWLLPNVDDADAVVVTNDGAFWTFDNGWHPSERLAQEYDAWFDAGV